MRKILTGLALMLVPAAIMAAPPALAAPQAGPGPSNAELATALCDSPDATGAQTVAGCSMLIKANIATGPDLGNILNNRAAGYLSLKQWDLAIADETKALTIGLNPNAFNNRCLAWSGKKLYDKAIADCSQAISMAPGNAHYFRNRASAQLQKGKRPEALADLRSAIKLDPKDPYAMNMLMSMAAKETTGATHIVDAKHPVPADLAARMNMQPAAKKPAPKADQ